MLEPLNVNVNVKTLWGIWSLNDYHFLSGDISAYLLFYYIKKTNIEETQEYYKCEHFAWKKYVSRFI